MIGIDIGCDGGIAVLDEVGDIINMEKPRLASLSGKKEWDGYWLANILEEFRHMEPIMYIEACGYHYRNVQAARSLAMCEGIIVGVASSLGYGIERVQAKVWQKALMGKIPQGRTKEFALDYAQQRWPQADWTKSKRATKADDGFVDAALIALYGLHKDKGLEL